MILYYKIIFMILGVTVDLPSMSSRRFRHVNNKEALILEEIVQKLLHR